MALAERDVRLALGIVEAAAATQNGTPFGPELLEALLKAIPADCAEYMEWPFHEEPSLHLANPYDLWCGDDFYGAMEVACQSYPLRDVRWAAVADEPLRITDLVSRRAYRHSAFYALMMRPCGMEHEVKLWLPGPARESRHFSLVRAGRDFSDRELGLLRLVRPYIARLRARWERAPRPVQLTERERDVLELVAQGLTNRQVAGRLSISTGTVRTHLEHVYEKLGVRTRAGAVAAAFRLAS